MRIFAAISNDINQMHTNSAQGFGAIASAFIIDSLALMLPWLITMGAVVALDLVTGIAKSMKLGIKIRPSKFVRDSISKFTSYFGFVVAMCFVEMACGGGDLAKYGCMLVISIEGISIIGNILKMKGYTLDAIKLLQAVTSWKFGVDKDKLEGIVVKDEHDNKESSIEGD